MLEGALPSLLFQLWTFHHQLICKTYFAFTLFFSTYSTMLELWAKKRFSRMIDSRRGPLTPNARLGSTNMLPRPHSINFDNELLMFHSEEFVGINACRHLYCDEQLSPLRLFLCIWMESDQILDADECKSCILPILIIRKVVDMLLTGSPSTFAGTTEQFSE